MPIRDPKTGVARLGAPSSTSHSRARNHRMESRPTLGPGTVANPGHPQLHRQKEKKKFDRGDKGNQRGCWETTKLLQPFLHRDPIFHLHALRCKPPTGRSSKRSTVDAPHWPVRSPPGYFVTKYRHLASAPDRPLQHTIASVVISILCTFCHGISNPSSTCATPCRIPLVFCRSGPWIGLQVGDSYKKKNFHTTTT